MEKEKKVKSIKVKVKIKLKRSSVPPITAADKKLSVVHLKDSIRYNAKHLKDHQQLEKKGGSKKYNDAHIKGHAKALKKDKKLLEKRQGEGKTDVPSPKKRLSSGMKPTTQQRALAKLKRGMVGYKR